MGQIYVQRFEYRGASSKSEFDQAWSVALQTGGVETGVRHIKTYGTAWGGYALIEVDAPEAFARYQTHHAQNYSHLARITFEPVFDLDKAFAQK